ncbi:MAG: DJ-1/PfpI family protein [Bacteroidia bacterium]|nr:DJ-1/PfpI family protein [Bacteroidia bacterium]
MKKETFVIVVPVYDQVDLMDIAAPRETFSFASNDKREIVLYYVGFPPAGPNGRPRRRPELVTTRCGLRFMPDATYTDRRVQRPDLVWVPGAAATGLRAMLDQPDQPFFKYIARVGAQARYVCSVCEGAIMLAQTGLLNGYTITTHHSFYACMAAYPEVTLVDGYPRYVKDENRVTGGGISSGLDEALYLVELIQGTQTALDVQNTMQYYPQPPVMGSITPSDTCPVEGMI